MDDVILNSAEMQTWTLLAYCMSDHTKQEYTRNICILKIYNKILSFIWL